MSTIMFPVGPPSAPIAAAIGSSMRQACRAPAESVARPRVFDAGDPRGTQDDPWMREAVLVHLWIAASARRRRSAITPSFSGRMAEIVPGVVEQSFAST
jgi:hypothetical protein